MGASAAWLGAAALVTASLAGCAAAEAASAAPNDASWFRCSWQDIALVERQVAPATGASLRRDHLDLTFESGSFYRLEACGRTVGVFWSGEGQAELRDPGPERAHVLHDQFDNLPGKVVMESALIVASDGALDELLVGTTGWADGPIPLPVRGAIEARLQPFNPDSEASRLPGEVLFAPEAAAGGIFAELRLVGLKRGEKSGVIEIMSPWISYLWSGDGALSPGEPGLLFRRRVGSTQRALLAGLPSEAAVVDQATAFAEDSLLRSWDLRTAHVEAFIQPTYGMDRDLKDIRLRSTLVFANRDATTRWLSLELGEGIRRTLGEQWGELEVKSVRLAQVATPTGAATVDADALRSVGWHRSGDRLFVDLGAAPVADERFLVEVAYGGPLLEPAGLTAIRPLEGDWWYPTPPLGDRHLFSAQVTLPRFWDAAVTGRRTEELVKGSRRTISSRTRRAVASGAIYIVDARTEVMEPLVEGQPVVRVLRGPNTALPNARVGKELSAWMERLEPLLGAFPYDELELVERSALGARSDVAGVIALPGLDAPPDQVLTSTVNGESLLAAVIRQYLVADMGARTYHDAWLIEALVSQAECFVLEDADKVARCQGKLASKRRQWLDTLEVNSEEWLVGPVWLGSLSGLASANLKLRAPLVLHRLRLLIGEEPSRALLRRVCDAYRGQELSTRSFILHAQAVAGVDLRLFFYGWVYATPQEPTARLTWQATEQADGTWTVDAEGWLDSGRTGDPLPMMSPMMMLLRIGGDGNLQRLVLTETPRRFRVDGLPAAPKKVELDPGHSFPGRTKVQRGEF